MVRIWRYLKNTGSLEYTHSATEGYRSVLLELTLRAILKDLSFMLWQSYEVHKDDIVKRGKGRQPIPQERGGKMRQPLFAPAPEQLGAGNW